jgi:hypothetical protein
MIQATMNVDAVYLVQTSFSRPLIPVGESNIIWNYLDGGDRRAGFTGTVGSGASLDDRQSWKIECLASSGKPEVGCNSEPIPNWARRHGKSWICTDEGCRPHKIGEFHSEVIEPNWDRDMPVISEVLSYVREEKPLPPPSPGKSPLYICNQNIDEEVPDYTAGKTRHSSWLLRNAFLCHTFQGTLHELETGCDSPYKSCVVMPIYGASPINRSIREPEEPWAYFVIFSSSHTKQFTVHERIYLRNFGSCLITEVLKRRVEAADQAKGVFIKR